MERVASLSLHFMFAVLTAGKYKSKTFISRNAQISKATLCESDS
jgi:hypothetical protein